MTPHQHRNLTVPHVSLPPSLLSMCFASAGDKINQAARSVSDTVAGKVSLPDGFNPDEFNCLCVLVELAYRDVGLCLRLRRRMFISMSLRTRAFSLGVYADP